MRYVVIITSEAELQDSWQDPITPCWTFVYNEQDLDECTEISEGQYEATYDSIVLTESFEFTRVDELNGGTFRETIPPGEYGIRPNSRRA